MLLIETIRVHGRQFENLEYHNRRAQQARYALFNSEGPLDFRDLLTVPEQLGSETFKCRVTYDEKIRQVEFMPYSPRPVRTLQLVENDSIEYSHKYAHRAPLEKMSHESRASDVVIVKNGLLTDTTFANLAFWDGTLWRTPATPLLEGTRRAQLLDAGVLKLADIRPEGLRHFRCARLLNALLVFEKTPVIPIRGIFR
jgi:4-amino-4-deoxychorismate lyase